MALCLGALSSIGLGAAYRIPSDQWTTTEGNRPYVSGLNASDYTDGDAWSGGNSGETQDVSFSSQSLPAGTYFVGVRSWRAAPSNAEIGVIVTESGSTLLDASYYSQNETGDSHANRWFPINGNAYGYRTVGTITVSAFGPISFTVRQAGFYSATFDDVVIYQTGDGYASQAEAAVAGGTSTSWQTLTASINVSASPPSIDLTGSREGYAFAHTIYFDSEGNKHSIGDLSTADQVAALQALTGGAPLPDGSGSSIQSFWSTNGGQRDAANYTMSERVAVYAALVDDGSPPAWWHGPTVGTIWNSQNRFDVLGDVFGDVGWRLLQELETAGSALPDVGWYSPESGSFVARSSWQDDFDANDGGSGGDPTETVCGMTASELADVFCSGTISGQYPNLTWSNDGCTIPMASAGDNITHLHQVSCPGHQSGYSGFAIVQSGLNDAILWTVQEDTDDCPYSDEICDCIDEVRASVDQANTSIVQVRDAVNNQGNAANTKLQGMLEKLTAITNEFQEPEEFERGEIVANQVESANTPLDLVFNGMPDHSKLHTLRGSSIPTELEAEQLTVVFPDTETQLWSPDEVTWNSSDGFAFFTDWEDWIGTVRAACLLAATAVVTFWVWRDIQGGR